MLPYLPPEAEEGLFELVHDLSAEGSRIAIEYVHIRDIQEVLAHPRLRTASEHVGVDLRALWNTDPRRDSVEWLRASRWSVTVDSAWDASERYGRPLDDANASMRLRRFVVAERGSAA